MPTIRSFKTTLQVFLGILFALLITAGVLGYRVLPMAAPVIVLVLLALVAALAIFASRFLDAVVHAVDSIAGYVYDIGEGHVPANISAVFPGELDTLKDSLNACNDGMAGVVEVNKVLQRMAVNDHTTKVSGTYRGIFGEVATATNLVLDRVKAVTLACNNVAKGDYKANLEQFKKIGRRSENDALLPGFIEMMEAVDALVHDAQELSAAAVKGELSKRADVTRHRGEYRKVIQGVNETLDAVIQPLIMAAHHVDQIAKGQVPAKIMTEAQGDFKTLRDSLNTCVDGLGGLLEAKDVLQRLAENDHTTKIRGNYQGVFAEVAAATNLALDRVKTATLVCNSVAKGDYQANLEQFKKIGKRSENDTFIPGFVEMMEAVDALVRDAEALSAAALKGDLAKRADVSEHQGEYRRVIQGVNDILDAITSPLKPPRENWLASLRARFPTR
jgi:methyl-accepting chemotaxis protein